MSIKPETRVRSIKKQSRKWLNPIGHNDTGSISWKVEIDKLENHDDPLKMHLHAPYLDADLSIADCNRKIHLNFDVYTTVTDSKELQDRIDKIRLLRHELQAFEDALMQGLAQLALQQRLYKEAVKAQKAKKAKKSQKPTE